MERIVAQTLIQRLADGGVDTIFGLPGDGINGIMEGLRRCQDRVRFIPVLAHHGAPVPPRRSGLPDPDELAAAADLLNTAQRPAVLAGAGALDARYEVAAVAHRPGAPVIETLPGKAVLPDDAALSVGGLGLLGTRLAEELIDDCDALLMVGTNFRYTKYLPAPGSGAGDADRHRQAVLKTSGRNQQ